MRDSRNAGQQCAGAVLSWSRGATTARRPRSPDLPNKAKRGPARASRATGVAAPPRRPTVAAGIRAISGGCCRRDWTHQPSAVASEASTGSPIPGRKVGGWDLSCLSSPQLGEAPCAPGRAVLRCAGLLRRIHLFYSIISRSSRGHWPPRGMRRRDAAARGGAPRGPAAAVATGIRERPAFGYQHRARRRAPYVRAQDRIHVTAGRG